MTSYHETQAEAIARARSISHNQHSELFVRSSNTDAGSSLESCGTSLPWNELLHVFHQTFFQLCLTMLLG